MIGMDGFIGRNLCRHLPDALKTTRKNAAMECAHYLDLLKPSSLPGADIAYLCAGVNGTMTCSDNPRQTWRVNVDGPIWIADQCRERGMFLVWIGSTTAQWLTEHYGEQKRMAELYLRTMPNVAIVRAGRVLQSNVDSLCHLMTSMGRAKKRGLEIWNADEQPYQK